MVEAKATARYVRTSAQKAGLVLDLIRGKDVNRALATLKFTRKGIAEDIAKVLRSAIANAQNKEGFSGDVDRLYVSACYANQGPSAKRVRPAPMGRAFNKTWRSRWYSDRDYAKLLHEDLALRQSLKKRFAHAGVSKIETERAANNLKIDIYTSRPGIIIGRKGVEVDKLKQEIQKR